MGLIAFLVLGALVGWIAARAAGRDTGLVMNLIIGIIGSFIGGFVSRLFIGADDSFLALDWSGLFWSFIGALILVAILNAMTGHRHHTAS